MPDERPLSDAERARLSTRVDQFYSDLASGPVENWDPYLAELAGPPRRTVLIELVLVHLGHQWKSGQRMLIEQYVARFPNDLGPLDKVPASMILEEYRCRLRAGLPKGIDVYRDRFPAQFPIIRDRLLAVESEASFRGANNQAVAAGGATLRGYQQVTRLGSGAFADVWLVRSPSGIDKAMKILRDRIDKEAAQRELSALEKIKNLRHQSLLRTEDFWIESEQLHIVTELADCTLRDRLTECRESGMPGIPDDELFGYVSDAATGLDYLHQRNLIHRDVKADNILLIEGYAKVADFGLARTFEANQSNRTLAGTPTHMAPEAWGKKATPASDQYSLAVAYAELRQGELPVEVLPYPEIMIAHMDSQYHFADFIPEAERAVIRKALSREVADRYPTCEAFVTELARATGRSYVGRRKGGSGAQPGLPESAVSPLPPPRPTAEVPLQVAETLQYVDTQVSPPKPDAATDVSTGKKIAAAVVVAVLLAGVGGLLLIALGPWGGDSAATTNGTDPTGTASTGTPPSVSPATNKPIKIDPPTDLYWLPSKESKPEENTPLDPIGGDRQAYRWIWVPFAVGDQQVFVRFRLIKGVKPFYLMEEKVWNRLYLGLPENDPRALLPAFNMARPVAAEWAKKFPGGRLPTAAEWDAAAAGLTSKGEPWVNQKEPSPSRKGKGADENEFGLLDLAGNGREWTESTITQSDGRVLAITRGRQFTFEKRLDPETLRREQKEPMTAFADNGNRYTGFRVLIPIPEK